MQALIFLKLEIAMMVTMQITAILLLIISIFSNEHEGNIFLLNVDKLQFRYKKCTQKITDVISKISDVKT
jgi:hypothetical protein